MRGVEALDRAYVVIPAYNEAGVIEQVLRSLERYVPRRRVIVVDDGSTDGTLDIARRAGAVALRHAINRGQGAALATGIRAALQLGAAMIITFDADGQHDPADIPAMVEPVRSGEADVVLGTRFHAGVTSRVPPVRRALLKVALFMTRLVTSLRITDVHNGFRVLSAEAAGRIRIRQDRMEHASEILDEIARHKLRYIERPVSIRYSAYSLAKGQKNRHAVGLAVRILLYKVGP